MTTAEAARLLLGWDRLLLLTHVRPDGDTVGSAAALCRALRDLGKTAYLLPNPQLTATYAPYAAPYTAPEGFVPDRVVSVDIAALSLLPENARPYGERIDLACSRRTPDHTRNGWIWPLTTIPLRAFLPGRRAWRRILPPAAKSCTTSSPA